MREFEIEIIWIDGAIFKVRVSKTELGVAAFILTDSDDELPIRYFKDEIQLVVWKEIARTI